MSDISIRNVSVLDGTGSEPFMADVYVTGGRISTVDTGMAGGKAAREIDGSGLTLAPGFIDSGMGKRGKAQYGQIIEKLMPMRRYGEERELVGAAVYLASPASDYTTGTVLLVDGGWTAQ